MRNAETILDIVRERGRRRLPLEGIYRQLYNRDRYLRAYSRLYRNHGAMTPGATDETVDGLALLNAARRKRIAGVRKEARKLRQQAQRMPSCDPNDPNFRRLWYCRYADDWLGYQRQVAEL